jgi:hypothetical protein
MKQRRTSHRRGEAGFTVIELLEVIVIIGVANALVLPAVESYFDRDELTAETDGLDAVRVAVDSDWEITGRLPPGIGIGRGSSLNLSLDFSNQLMPLETDIPIDVPPCPGDPCPVFSLTGSFDDVFDLDPDRFVDGDTVDLLLQAAIDLHPTGDAAALAPDRQALSEPAIDDFNLSWTGQARVSLLYDVPAPGIGVLLAVAFGAVAGWRSWHRTAPSLNPHRQPSSPA